MFTMINGEPVDVGVAYGYCYVPQVYGSGSLLSFSPADDGKNWKPHPVLETQGEAEEWLRSRGLRGEVLRYAHHEFPQDRGADYRPWITAGIVAFVDGELLESKCAAYADAAQWTRNQHNRGSNDVRLSTAP